MNRNTNISIEEFSIIEQYLLKQMPEREYDAFTQKMQNDTDLNAKVDEVKLLLTGIQEAALLEKIETYHNELSGTKKNNTSRAGILTGMKFWLAAASILIIVAIGTLFYTNSFNKEERLFTDFYRPDSGLISAMSTSDNYLFDRAMIDYKTGKYDAAIASWQQLLDAMPENDTLHYFIASALLAESENEQAIQHFEKVIGNRNSNFYEDACWYSGLAHLRVGKKTEAIELIKNSSHPEKDALLTKLEK